MRLLLTGGRLDDKAGEIARAVEEAFYEPVSRELETVYAEFPEGSRGEAAMRRLEALWFEREDAKVKAALASRQAVSPLE